MATKRQKRRPDGPATPPVQAPPIAPPVSTPEPEALEALAAPAVPRTKTRPSSASANGKASPADRVAIVAGLRTPFTRPGGALREHSAAELGGMLVAELLARFDRRGSDVELLAFGQALPTLRSPIAADVAVTSGLSRSVEFVDVQRGAASSLGALTLVATAIRAGECGIAVAGGAESASDVPVAVPRRLAAALGELAGASSMQERIRALRAIETRDLVPFGFAGRDRATGLTLGELAERLAKEEDISRDEQDAYALLSHKRAAEAWAQGIFKDDVFHVVAGPAFDRPVIVDDAVRRDATAAAFGELRPVHDPRWGTVTEGNSAPHADGAAALLVMSEARAKAEGYVPLGFLRSWAFAAADAQTSALLGAAFAIPRALDRAKLALADVGVFELHEEFAAQVLATDRALASRGSADGEDAARAIDRERLNAHGGSIALGHPVAATGARLVLTALRELQRTSKQFAVVATSASAGLGAAVVLEVGP